MLGRFLKDARGNIALIAALAALPLFGAAGIAVDTFRQSDAQARLQAALDAGALAGAAADTTNKAEIRKIVRQFARSNGIGELLKNDKDIKVMFRNNGTMRVEAAGTINTTIGGVLGVKTMPVTAFAEVKPNSGGTEVALVLDTTDSMNSEGRIDALRAAARDFVNEVTKLNENGEDRIKISLVPYASYVNVGTDKRSEGWLDAVNDTGGNVWHGCVGPREYPKNKQDSGYGNRIPPVLNTFCAQQIQPLTGNKTTLVNRINALTAQGLTYIPGGLMWGWRTLSDQAPYTEGEGPTVAAAKNIHKFVVLMTDGLNTLEKVAGTPVLIHNNFVTTNSDKLMLEVCENVKQAGITVFTIGFKLQQATMKEKLEECASTPENYYDASDNAQLAASYKAIANKVSAIHLSK